MFAGQHTGAGPSRCIGMLSLHFPYEAQRNSLWFVLREGNSRVVLFNIIGIAALLAICYTIFDPLL